MIRIADQHIVSLRFAMKDASGELLEDNLNAAPISYLQGGSQIVRELQVQVEGMLAGEQRQVAFEMPGTPTRRFLLDVCIDSVRPATELEIQRGGPVDQQDHCGPGCECTGEPSSS
ncbi:MAG: hypothetical protein KGO82_13345 [Bacteroidota bacterium]|nr:hypothetical protein [Bacteroidota bacterium]